MVELVTVIVLIGILGAIGASRFADSTLFASRTQTDQVKSLIRYAQKLAIAQNRDVFVRSRPAGFAVCYTANCAAGSLAPDPAGGNNGSAATRIECVSNNLYVANWACIGTPAGTVVNTAPARNEFGAAGFFFFDAMGRPHNNGDVQGGVSTFLTRMTLTFSTGGNNFALAIEPETGYVH